MASTEQHFAAALRINAEKFNFVGNDLKEYLLGAIACDAPKLKKQVTKIETKTSDVKKVSTPSDQERKAGRAYTHYLRPSINPAKEKSFISIDIAKEYGYKPVDDRGDSPVCYEQFCPMLDYFMDKNADHMNEPFMLGYLAHLVADDVYFSKVIPEIVSQNSEKINDYITDKFSKDGYEKKPYLTNGEYLKWSHTTMYQQYGYYNILAVFGFEQDMPDMKELSTYLKEWESSNRDFKPSMVDDLNDTESICDYLENANNSAQILEENKQTLKESSIVSGASVYGVWPYDLFLDYLDETAKEASDILESREKRRK